MKLKDIPLWVYFLVIAAFFISSSYHFNQKIGNDIISLYKKYDLICGCQIEVERRKNCEAIEEIVDSSVSSIEEVRKTVDWAGYLLFTVSNFAVVMMKRREPEKAE